MLDRLNGVDGIGVLGEFDPRNIGQLRGQPGGDHSDGDGLQRGARPELLQRSPEVALVVDQRHRGLVRQRGQAGLNRHLDRAFCGEAQALGQNRREAG